MHCTNCGADVADGAKFCPGCGTPTGAAAAAGPAAAEKPKAGKGCATGGAIVGVLIAVYFIAGGGAGEKDAAPDAARPEMRVTAQELFAAYQDNEARAQQTYGGSRLVVTGTVAGVDLDLTDDPVVKLQTSNQFMSASASLADESKDRAGSLSKGQQVTLTCESVGEVVGTPMLRDCRL